MVSFPNFFVASGNGFAANAQDFVASGDETSSRRRDLVRTEIDVGLHADREVSGSRQSDRDADDIQFGLVARSRRLEAARLDQRRNRLDAAFELAIGKGCRPHRHRLP